MSSIGVFHTSLRENDLIPQKKHTLNKGGRNKGILAAFRAMKRRQAEERHQHEKLRAFEQKCRDENIGPATKRALGVARKVLTPEMFDIYTARWLSTDGPGIDF
jgi:hypothetical protein